MFLFAITFIVGAIQYMQWYYFEDNYIIVRSLFGTIIKLNMEKAQAYIETLPTSFSWATVIDKRWICIYDENIINNFMHRFKSGCSNDKKHKRIQIIFNQNNIENISQRLKINKRQIF